MQQGYIKLHRQIQDSELWYSEKFTKAQAWVDMIMLANHKDNMFFKRGIEVQIKRGQLAWSERKLSERWGWSRDKVRRFLKWLKTRQQIRQQKSHIISIVEIVNYELYQGNDTTDKTTEKPQTRQQKNTNNNVKNNKNENNDKNSKKRLCAESPEIPYREIIDYLNLKLDTKYQSSSEETQKLIKSRWKQGFRLEDFKAVIDKKILTWGNDAQMSAYLRPSTLFGNKFESYLNEKNINKTEARHSEIIEWTKEKMGGK